MQSKVKAAIFTILAVAAGAAIILLISHEINELMVDFVRAIQ